MKIIYEREVGNVKIRVEYASPENLKAGEFAIDDLLAITKSLKISKTDLEVATLRAIINSGYQCEDVKISVE
jgi:hypothetical protein